METTKPLLFAAQKQVSRIDERFEGYRALLVQCLVSVIQVQAGGGSQMARRGRVEAQVIAAAEKATARLEERTK